MNGLNRISTMIVALVTIIFLIHAFSACREDRRANEIDSTEDQILDSLITSLTNLNEQEIFDSSTYELAVEIIEQFEHTENWSRGEEVFNLLFDNGDIDSPSFYDYMVSLHEHDTLPDSIRVIPLFYAASIDERLGRFDTAKRLFETYAEYCFNHSDSNCNLTAYNILANIAMRKGDCALAHNYLDHYYNRIQGDADSSLLLNHYYRKGQASFYGAHYDEALKFFGKAVQYETKTDIDLRLYYAECLVNLHRFEAAEEYLFRLDVPSSDSFLLSYYNQVLGYHYLNQNKEQKSLEHFNRGLNIARSYFSNSPRALGKFMADLVIAYEKFDEPDKGIDLCNEALKIFDPTCNPLKRPMSVHDFQNQTEIWIPELLRLKSAFYLKKFQRSLRPDYLDTALEHIEVSHDLFNRINAGYKYDRSRYYLSANLLALYSHWLELIELSPLPQEIKYAKYFEIIQRSQAFSLRQSIRERIALEISGIPPALIDSLTAIQKQIALFQGQVNNQSDDQKMQKFQDSLFWYEQLEDNMEDRMQHDFPAYAVTAGNEQLVELHEVQNRLADDELLIQYFCKENNISILGIRKDTAVFLSGVEVDNLNEYISQYNSLISDFRQLRKSPKAYEKKFITASGFLYSALLHDIVDILADTSIVKKLIIAASGPIASIAFDALIKHKDEDWLNGSAYLIHDYAISYNIIMNEIDENDQSESITDLSVLALGLEYDEKIRESLQQFFNDTTKVESQLPDFRGKSLSALAFAPLEAKEIVNRFGGKLLLNEEANKANFIKHAGKHKLIHISSHAFVDQESPYKSCFILSPHTGDISSAFFHLREIGQLGLNCEQVVLSACETAAGSVLAGEGVISISRYFRRAGAKSVVASNWSIPDEPTYRIMKLYYDYLSLGEDKDVALQHAKLNYIRDDNLSSPSMRSPAFWAAFSLYGNRKAIVEKSN